MHDVSTGRIARPTSSRRYPPNLDPAPLRAGATVYLQGEIFIAELVERQGQEWVAGIVALGMSRRSEARMRFVPVRELEWDEPTLTGPAGVA